MSKRSLADKILPKSVKDAVLRAIDPFIKLRANGKGQCSAKTQEDRRHIYLRCVAELWMLGYRIRKLESLAAKHVECLMTYWHESGHSPSLMHTRLSMLRVACDRMGKFGVVKDITDYLPSEVVRRGTVATENKAWEAKDIDPLEVIETAKQIDERFAVMLALQHHLGLRVKEAIELTPANAIVDGGEAIELYEGTKGGKLRRIDLDTPQRKAVIAWARLVAAQGRTKRLRWPDCTWKQARNRFYHYIRNRLGVSKALTGTTAHGLRHGNGQQRYRHWTGLPTPIEGGALGRIDREKHQAASICVSRELGHNRIDVTTGYYGSYGHQLRQAPVKMSFNYKIWK
ncbi:MAG: Integrase [Pseudomonadota bacterium]|nr:Integrase [Pseudomonadota bacterium]